MPLLRSELKTLTAQTVSLAMECRLARKHDSNSRLTLSLVPTVEQEAAARANHDRLQRWSTIVSSVLRRRGMAASDLHETVAELSKRVLLQRPDVFTVRKPEWCAAFERDVVTLRVTLERLLTNAADAFAPIRRDDRPETILNVRVLPSGDDLWHVDAIAGTSRATEIVPAPTSMEIQELLATYGGPSEPGEDVPRILEFLTQFGKRLFGTLFQSSIAALYERLCKRPLRIQFAADSLAVVPWELLHDGTRFFTLGNGISVSRDLAGPLTEPSSQPDPPFRILLTISSPSGLLGIDRDAERKTVEDAVASRCALGLLQLDVAPDGTMATLRRMIRNAELEGRPYHAWHFAGHGRYDPDTRRSVIALTRDDGAVHWVGGPELAKIFGGSHELKTVILKSCEGAQGDVAAQWCDLVPTFLDSGAEAVVAMRFELSYDASSAFDREFYGAIADGNSLDEALAAARNGIVDQSNYTEWFTPVIFRRRGEVAWLDSTQP